MEYDYLLTFTGPSGYLQQLFAMKTTHFTYTLPDDRIAQEPCSSRDQSRMMVVHREEGTIDCLRFVDFPRYLGEQDVLVVNDSRVIPARLIGNKSTGGRVEILLLEQGETPARWLVLLRPARRIARGTRIFFGDDGDYGDVVERVDDKKWILHFTVAGDFDSFLTTRGSAPLPPYIKRDAFDNRSPEDLDRYQTLYAAVPGSIAAPTAGLHFSDSVLEALENRRVTIASVTLHVGFGTFVPVETEDVEDHRMERERYHVSEESARAINNAGRVIAVGTTSVRTMESAARKDGTVQAGPGETNLFIYPGFEFKVVDALLTNFHLPASSLFLLVCAFGGTDLMKRAYQIAIDERFRFYSYGDCMLIL